LSGLIEMRLDSWFDTNIGLIRKSNQDAVGCFPDLPLFVVADGMGGRAQGEVASRMAVDIMHECFQESPTLNRAASKEVETLRKDSFWRTLFSRTSPPPASDDDGGGDGGESPTQRLRAAIELANEKIFEAGHTSEGAPAQGAMGTTIVALDCVLDQGRTYWAHVGDSRLYRLRAGELSLLTADHTLLGEAFWDQPNIPSDLPHTNRLMRALGITPSVEVTLGQDGMQPGDLYFLCTDGVSGMVKPNELHEELKRERPLAETGAAIIQKALDGGGRDNASLLLVRIVGD
jgi:PPM family protein phosphatase